MVLPIRDGGLGIKKLREYADISYEVSTKINKPLIRHILTQSDDLPDVDEVKDARSDAVSELRAKEKEMRDKIKTSQDPQIQRTLEQLSEPGASSWLGALPIEEHGFNLSKAEFHDALALRYRRTAKNLPSKCPCGQAFTTTHAMNCSLGGFINARHDNIRDLECKLLKSVQNDVECEPILRPVLNKTGYPRTAKLEDNARLDIRARGFWRDGQNAYFDVRVTNADNDSQQNTSLKSVLRKHEQEKKRCYNKRIMEVEHGTFTPLVFTTTGVMSHECAIFHKCLAHKLSVKKNERYEEIVRYMRVKFSFLALKSTLLCLRGSRSVSNSHEVDCDFGLALNDLGLR